MFFLSKKLGCYKPTPLKMNLIPEIQIDRKRSLETRPLTLSSSLSQVASSSVYSIALCTS
jgi:hypothetical protein